VWEGGEECLDASTIHNFHCSKRGVAYTSIHLIGAVSYAPTFCTPPKMCLCKIYDEENLRALRTSPPATSRPIPSPPYLLVASIALSSPTILKLFPRPNLPLIKPAAGINVSSQCLNTAFMSLGTPSMTTVVTGMNGLSSSETARMLYSCAKRRAVAKAWDCVRDRGPMILFQVSTAISQCIGRRRDEFRLTCTSQRKHPVHRHFPAPNPAD
jgi:hypothetical protein